MCDGRHPLKLLLEKYLLYSLSITLLPLPQGNDYQYYDTKISLKMDNLAKSWFNGMSKVKSCEGELSATFQDLLLTFQSRKEMQKKVPNF
jgi:hypothetical protein